MVRAPDELMIRKLFREGLAPSLIDQRMKLCPGTAHDSIVYDWAEDRKRYEEISSLNPLESEEKCHKAWNMTKYGSTIDDVGRKFGVTRDVAQRMVEKGQRIAADAKSWELRHVSKWRWPTIAAELQVSENTARKMARRHEGRIT